ncbi:Nucleotidyltransferase [Lenzites betulinus]|nr:Nucleotidyltransferase [Lenzites betulinus]
MSFKRPAIDPTQSGSPSESSSSSLLPRAAKLLRINKSLPDVKIYIVQAKLDVASISELFNLGERHTKGVCKSAADADVIITAVSMLRRFERHVPWNIARNKAVVTPQWLRDSVQRGSALPCGAYNAIAELHETTVKNCPDCNCESCACSDASADTLPISPPGSSDARRQSPSPPTSSATFQVMAGAAYTVAPSTPVNLLPQDPPLPTNPDRLDYTSRYSCQRASPLVCPNQALAGELDIVRQSRALEGEERSALSYQRAISVIKAYPETIRSIKQVQRLPYIGVKLSGMVEEFLDNGHITEAQAIKSSERFQTLSLFSSVYGIGAHTARRLFGLGLRSLDDLEIYYGVEREDMQAPQPEIVEVDVKQRKPGWVKGQRDNDEGLGDSWIRVALGLREDFSRKIPRYEVEEMGRVVMRELDELQPGCVSTIAGGYRRGKLDSNDVDIVFTHPDANKVKGLCKRLVQRLHERGMVTHVMHLSGLHGHNPLRTTHWDSLEKSLTVFMLPSSSAHHTGVRRRLDLIFAPPNIYWTAVVGWSGSIMFQRDLRQWAKDKHGMKFDSSGITRRYDSKEIYPKTEKEVFELLGLEWVDPTWRNADL